MIFPKSLKKIPEIKISIKIVKLTYQMISKSLNRKLTIKGFQRNQKYQISSYILGVIVLKSQRPNWINFEQHVVKRQIEGSNVGEN